MLIWGNKGYSDQIGYIIHECPGCKQTSAFSVYQTRKKFTLYFIPTFSYSNKQFIECGECKTTYEVPKEMKEEVGNSLMSQEELSALIARTRQEQITQGAQTAAQEIEDSKECPYCGETIKRVAVYCRFCEHDLTEV
jgi:hypothetical protein